MNRGRADTPGAEASGPRTRGADPSLRAALDTLDGGCGMLVTGDVPTDAHRVAATRYFGDPSNPRRRVLGLTHDTPRPNAWLPGSVSADSGGTAIVRRDDTLRSAGASGGSPASDGGLAPSGPVDDGFGRRFLDAIDEVSVDGGDEMTLRVGLYRVDGLRATLGESGAGDVLREAAATTRDRGGMAHFHLPRRPVDGEPRSDPLVDGIATQLGEVLDVVVELRLRDRAVLPEERWHIHGWGTTDWYPLG
ncbi:DUF7504 family protein [Halorarum salinum]|uniref:Uncharacterized protein n=1 Tax=Halorarum salinum TaxID=2743089 RepID=A0A7D5QBZ1_9EURY|nr:hypothetical protein [Halobaculum salinum]QLG62240.1 hypothetical protein HUG12_11075 [Halobaculum salinum]